MYLRICRYIYDTIPWRPHGDQRQFWWPSKASVGYQQNSQNVHLTPHKKNLRNDLDSSIWNITWFNGYFRALKGFRPTRYTWPTQSDSDALSISAASASTATRLLWPNVARDGRPLPEVPLGRRWRMGSAALGFLHVFGLVFWEVAKTFCI